MPKQIRAVVVDPTAPEQLAIKQVDLRAPDRDEVGVRVTALSIAVRRGAPCSRPSRGGGPVGISLA